MTFIILGIFLFVALAVLGQKFPQLGQYRWWLAALAAAVLIVLSMVKIVPPGHVGVLVLFGRVHGVISEGLHFVNPLVTMELMSVRTQEVFERVEAPSKEGLNMVVEVSLLYHLNPEAAMSVYRQLGPRYREVVVIPQFRSAIRSVTVRHEARDLYTSGRELITNEILRILEEELKPRGLIVEAILMRRMILPKAIEEAINAKLAADQDAQRMRFVLEKERQEAERKRVEAQGIQDFQRIISMGLNEQLLRWKGIEATEHLAKSPNTKVIIVGGRDGLPLILNAGPEAR